MNADKAPAASIAEGEKPMGSLKAWSIVAATAVAAVYIGLPILTHLAGFAVGAAVVGGLALAFSPALDRNEDKGYFETMKDHAAGALGFGGKSLRLLGRALKTVGSDFAAAYSACTAWGERQEASREAAAGKAASEAKGSVLGSLDLGDFASVSKRAQPANDAKPATAPVSKFKG